MSKGENRSTIIGFALIGIILLLFSWYNTKQYEKQQKERYVADSTAAARALESARLDTTYHAVETDDVQIPVRNCRLSGFLTTLCQCRGG